MKFKVTLPSSVLCDTLEDAMTLVAKAGPGTVIEVVDETAAVRRGRPKASAVEGEAPKRRGRPPKVAVEGEPAPKRRGRPPKVKSVEAEAEQVEAEGEQVEAEAEQVEAEAEQVDQPELSRKEVMDAFGTLIDRDYERAAALLEKFRVTRFSELPEESLPAFYAELKEAA